MSSINRLGSDGLNGAANLISLLGDRDEAVSGAAQGEATAGNASEHEDFTHNGDDQVCPSSASGGPTTSPAFIKTVHLFPRDLLLIRKSGEFWAPACLS